MREKLLELKIDTTQVLRDNLDAVYLTEHDADQILSLLEEEIKKRLLTDEEIKQIGRTTCDGSMVSITKIVAQAQVNNTLKIVEEK